MKPVVFLIPFVLAFVSNGCTSVRGQSQPNVTIELIGLVSIAADATDHSGLTDFVTDGIPHNRIGGISAIGRLGADQYLLLADRGPLDGAVPFQCRYSTATIKIDPNSRLPVKLSIDNTTILGDGGHPFVGLSSVFAATSEFAGRFDPEGICVAESPDDKEKLVYVSEEYGPKLVAFDFNGQRKFSYELPTEFLIAKPGVDWQTENGQNVTGRQSNRGMEGLTITPGGKYLVGIMQSPLLQDSRTNPAGIAAGVNVRIVRVDRVSGEVAQFVYQLDDTTHMVSEILAISETSFLVIDRDGASGELASKKMIVLIDIGEATKLPPNTTLPPFVLPAGIRPASKSNFLDLLDKKYGLAGIGFPAKIEGLCFGPELPDGRQTLLVLSDNDFIANQPTELMVFTMPGPAKSESARTIR